MSVDPEKQERAKEIRTLLARWKKRQRSKQKELPFLKPKDAFQHTRSINLKHEWQLHESHKNHLLDIYQFTYRINAVLRYCQPKA